jgi:hypothetical protein
MLSFMSCLEPASAAVEPLSTTGSGAACHWLLEDPSQVKVLLAMRETGTLLDFCDLVPGKTVGLALGFRVHIWTRRMCRTSIEQQASTRENPMLGATHSICCVISLKAAAALPRATNSVGDRLLTGVYRVLNSIDGLIPTLLSPKADIPGPRT